MIVLIPAYEPGHRLIDLIHEIVEVRAAGVRILVVDDGSGPEYSHIFREIGSLGCEVIGHVGNRGKGYALKRGFDHIARFYPDEPVVTADADGQHRVDDILAVAHALAERNETMVLGARHFDGSTPLRSRFGNVMTRLVFALSTGHRVADTQTGLRAFPPGMLHWLQTVDGDRFDYEINVLLGAVERGCEIEEIPIETVYLESNRSSHFRPLADSARVYAPLVRFSLSSVAAFILDFVLLLLFQAATGNLLLSVVGARVCSSIFNYLTNRHLVFQNGVVSGLVRSATGYFALVGVVLAANYALMHLLTAWAQIPLALAKVSTETILFFFSYLVQKRLVFAQRSPQMTEAARVTIDA